MIISIISIDASDNQCIYLNSFLGYRLITFFIYIASKSLIVLKAYAHISHFKIQHSFKSYIPVHTMRHASFTNLTSVKLTRDKEAFDPVDSSVINGNVKIYIPARGFSRCSKSPRIWHFRVGRICSGN